MKKILTIAALASTVLASGCASILTEKTTKVNVVTSNGQKATVSVDGQDFEVPGVITVQKNGEDKTLSSTTPGCANSVNMTKQIEPTFWVNILSGGTFGSTTDMSTKKMWKYQDNVTLTCSK